MKHTAVNLVTSSCAPSNSWKFIRSYIVALDLFCCHCRRHLYVSHIRFQNCASPTEESKQGRPLYVSIAMAGKKITFDEEGISEILVIDTDTESGSEASDFENDFEEEEEEEEEKEEEEDQHHHHHHHHHHHQQQASAEVETQAATSGGLPTWGPPQVRNTNIHPFVGPAKGVKKSETPHINKDSSPLSVLV